MTDDLVAEAGADVRRCNQSSNESPTEYKEALCNMVLRCDRIYEGYGLKVIFIEGIP